MLPIAFRVLSAGAHERASSGPPIASADRPVRMARVVRLEAPSRVDAPRGAPASVRSTGNATSTSSSRLARAMALRDLLIERACFADVAAGACCGLASEDALVVVVSGRVELRIGADEERVAELEKGDAFGFVPAPRPDVRAVFVADRPSRVARVSPADVHAALRARPELATQIAAAARGWIDALAHAPGRTKCATTELRDASWAWQRRPPLVPRDEANDVATEVHTICPPSSEPPIENTVIRAIASCRAPSSLDPTERRSAWEEAESERIEADAEAMRPFRRLRQSALWAAILSGPAVIVLLLATQIPLTSEPASLRSIRSAAPTVERVAPRAGSVREDLVGSLPLLAAPALARAATTSTTPPRRSDDRPPSVGRAARGADAPVHIDGIAWAPIDNVPVHARVLSSTE